jgi:hypothetical protein
MTGSEDYDHVVMTKTIGRVGYWESVLETLSD